MHKRFLWGILLSLWTLLLPAQVMSGEGDSPGSETPMEEAGIRLDIASTMIEFGDIQRAWEQLEEVEQILAKEPSDSLKARYHHQLGNLYLKTQSYQSSEGEYRKALALYEQRGERLAMAQMHNNLGVLYRKDSLFEEAAEAFALAERVALALGETGRTLLAKVYGNQGNLAKKQQNWEAARDFYEKGLALEEQSGNAAGMAGTWVNLGLLAHSRGQFAEAVTFFEQATEVKGLREMNYAQIQAWRYRSQSLQMLGKSEEALRSLERHLEMQDAWNDRQQSIQANYLQVAYDLSQTETALAKSQAAEQSQRRIIWIGGGAIILLLLSGGLWLNRQQLKRKFETRNRELALQKQILEMESALLRLQMNPHFIFNSLTSIAAYVYQKDHQTAAQLLEKFSRLMRYILAHSARSEISVLEEIQSLRLYLDLEKERFGDDLDFSIEIGEGIGEDVLLPPLLVQPLVENALRHGIGPKQGPGKVEVLFAMDGDCLLVSIRDDGVGIADSVIKKEDHERPHALDLIRRRLRVLYPGGPDLFQIRTAKPAGTEVRLRIPQD